MPRDGHEERHSTRVIVDEEGAARTCEGRLWDGRPCERPARHWTHVFMGDRRLVLCGVHYNMIAKRRRQNYTGNGLIMLWHGLGERE